MSSSSDDSPNQDPVSQVTQANHDQQDSKVDTEKETSPLSVFVNKEPIREEQVQNAVKFLSHPKVRGSPVVYRRSFLERKGLTKEEIDEAFRRVPDSSPTVTATNSTTNQDGLANSLSNVQQQPQAQVLQSTAVGPLKSTSKAGTFYHFRWYHGVLAIGLLTASQVAAAVFFKRFIVPKLKSWIRWIVLEENGKRLAYKNGTKPSAAEEAAAAAKAAAMAAADVARASQEIVMTKSEEKRCLEELVSMLHMQASEMKSLSSAIHKLEGGHKVNGRIALEEQENNRISRTSSAAFQQPHANGNGKVDFDSQSVRTSLPPAPTAEPSAAPHPKSYMEILAMIQRGEKPSNIREINDAPPNPNQPLPNPRLAPKPKPWEVSQPQSRSSVNTFSTQVSSNGATNDFSNDYLNGDNALPTWQRANYRVMEIETVDEKKFGLGNEQPVKKLWVPPQPPPVAMPEAAAAIRQPKKSSFPLEQLTDDDRQSADETNELQKITEISEKGGSMEANGQNFEVPLNEIVPEEKALHLEA